MPAGSDRNLLFGMLALQMDFISRTALIEGMQAWLLDKSRTLGEILVERGALVAANRSLLDPLVEAHIKQHGGDARKSLAALSSDAGLGHDLNRIDDVEIRASIAALPKQALFQAGALSSAAPIHVQESPSSESASEASYKTQLNESNEPQLRYLVLRPHAEGGLGRIYVALDQELNREVAFKEIRQDRVSSKDARDRFKIEAEITGGLEHPGIVPVYGLGHFPDGRPFYAMRFIRGDSLLEAVRRFHRKDDSGRSMATSTYDFASSLPFRDMVKRLIDVCNAIQYAHDRGVLHRDLKPDNIMLGQYGETLVVDWGLAKAGIEQPAGVSNTSERPFVPLSGSQIDATQHGQAMGTYGFMSPEQSEGKLDLLGPTSDVYSLGATLYSILTGEAPLRSFGLAELLTRLRKGDVPAPRSIQSKTPRPLEAICQKAMALELRDRYPSAKAMTTDLDAWLADQPVSAYREPLSLRTRRWLRRHPVAVSTSSVALILTLVGLGLFSSLLAGKNSELDEQKNVLISTNQRLITARSEAELAKEQANQARRNAELALVAEQAAKEHAVRAESESKELALEKSAEADKANRLSSFLLGLFEASDPVRQGKGVFVGKPSSVNLTARDLLDRGAKKLNDNELNDVPLTRATIAGTIGDVYRQLGLFDDAKPLLEESLRLRQLYRPEGHSEIGACFHDLGTFYNEVGDFVKGRNCYSQALEIRRNLPGEKGLEQLASTLNDLGWMAASEMNFAEARTTLLEAANIREKLFGFNNRDYVFSHVGIAFCLIQEDRWIEAVNKLVWAQSKLASVDDNQNITTALTTFAAALVAQKTLGPMVSHEGFKEAYRLANLELGPDNLYTALARFELGHNLELLGRNDEAMPHYEFCLRIARETMQLQHPRFRALIKVYTNQLKNGGKTKQGEELWEEFLAAQKKRFGENHYFYYEAMVSQTAYLSSIGKHDEAIDNYKKIEIGLIDLEFELKDWLRALCHCEHTAILCNKKREFAKAEKVAYKAITIFEEHPELKTKHPIEWMYLNCDLAESILERDSAAAGELLDRSLALAKKSPKDERSFATNYAMALQTKLFLKQGDYANASILCLERKKFCRKEPGKMAGIAKDLMRCISAVDSTAALSEDQKRPLIESYSKSAIEVLRNAIAAGWENRQSLQKDKLFERLSDREDFKALLEN